MNTFTLTTEETELLFESISELKQNTLWKIVCLAANIGDVEFKKQSIELHQLKINDLNELNSKMITKLTRSPT